MKFRLLIITLLFVGTNLFSQQKYYKVRIFANKQETKKIQKLGIDLENISGKLGIFIDVEISEKELQIISKNNFSYKILIDDVSKFYSERYKVSAKKNKGSLKGVNYTTPTHFNLGSMGGFLTLSEVMDELDEMRAVYPNLITAKFIIGDVGNNTTLEGRNIYAVKISDNSDTDETATENEVLYTSLIHAREPESMQQLIWYMWYLLENYATNDEIKYLVDNLEMYFIPVINADSYEYNYATNPNGGGMWRKNKRDNNGDEIFNEDDDGVDLNRNFGYQWGYDNSGSSPDGTTNTYRGASAFSEPTTQIIKYFTNSHNFLLAHNHHTYSNFVLFPFGYEEIHAPDDAFLRTSATLMASENEYTVGQAWEILYAVNGDAGDWMYGEQDDKPKIMAYTQETGGTSDGFWPTQDRIISLCEESYLSNLYLARFATPFGELTDKSPNYINKHGYLKFNLKRMGLSGDGNYTVSIIPNSSIFSNLGNSKIVNLSNVLDSHTDSISYILSEDIQYGDQFTYTVTVTSVTYSVSKDFTKSYYQTEIVVDDPCDNLENWTSTSWTVTSAQYYSESNSITDSEGGDYNNDANTSITLINPIDLTNVENPQLSFWAKWNIENNWDYVQLFISTNNGTNWLPIATNKTNIGEGSNQPNGEPLFDGASSWTENTVDLSSYINQSVKFKFELHSDGSVTEDGFYFDDFKLTSTLSSPTLLKSIEDASIKIYPNPANNIFSVEIPKNINAQKINFLNISGKIIKSVYKPSDKTIINVCNIPKGIYFINIYSTKKLYSKKIIIK